MQLFQQILQLSEVSDTWNTVANFLVSGSTFLVAWIAIWMPFFTAWVARRNLRNLTWNFIDELNYIVGKSRKQQFEILSKSRSIIEEMLNSNTNLISKFDSNEDAKFNASLANVLAADKIYETGGNLLALINHFRDKIKTKNAENYLWLIRQEYTDAYNEKNKLSVLDHKLGLVSSYKEQDDIKFQLKHILELINNPQDNASGKTFLKLHIGSSKDNKKSKSK